VAKGGVVKKRTRGLKLVGVGLVLSAVFVATTPLPANAFIHEMIAAACRAGGEEVVPPGQAGQSNGKSFVRALQATGVIESIDTSVPGQVTINFDLSKPNAKFESAGFDLIIENGFGPGVDLILSPLPVIDLDFPAHSNCHNLNP
jgi:hypothetical protein